MNNSQPPIHLDNLAKAFAVELHLSAAPLTTIVRQSVNDAYARGLTGAILRSWLAMEIEDRLGLLGHGLDRYLNDEARANWSRDCGQAFDKALRKVSSASSDAAGA